VASSTTDAYQPLTFRGETAMTAEQYKTWAESVWLGGPVNWNRAVAGDIVVWTSETFITDGSGTRFTADELAVIRASRASF
jgi:hypothetical protein